MRLYLALISLALCAQTRIKPDQIRNWQQVRNPNSTGTSISLSQTTMGPSAIDHWKQHTTAPTYEAYRVAVVWTQPSPILITCRSVVIGKGGCADHFPLWFAAKVKR